jgi:hypothetical protein
MCDVLGVTVYAQKRGNNLGADGPGYRTVLYSWRQNAERVE